MIISITTGVVVKRGGSVHFYISVATRTQELLGLGWTKLSRKLEEGQREAGLIKHKQLFCDLNTEQFNLLASPIVVLVACISAKRKGRSTRLT